VVQRLLNVVTLLSTQAKTHAAVVHEVILEKLVKHHLTTPAASDSFGLDISI
jgi:hypothetical protein